MARKSGASSGLWVSVATHLLAIVFAGGGALMLKFTGENPSPMLLQQAIGRLDSLTADVKSLTREVGDMNSRQARLEAQLDDIRLGNGAVHAR